MVCVLVCFRLSNCLPPFRPLFCIQCFTITYPLTSSLFGLLFRVLSHTIYHEYAGNCSQCKEICKRFTLQYTNEWHHFEKRGKEWEGSKSVCDREWGSESGGNPQYEQENEWKRVGQIPACHTLWKLVKYLVVCTANMCLCVCLHLKIPNCGKKWKTERWETTCKSESKIANKYAEEKLQYIKYILCERPEEMKQLYKIRV